MRTICFFEVVAEVRFEMAFRVGLLGAVRRQMDHCTHLAKWTVEKFLGFAVAGGGIMWGLWSVHFDAACHLARGRDLNFGC